MVQGLSCRSALDFRPEDLVHGHADIVVDGEPGQQRMVLEHDGAVRAES